jgi:diguanylate cyclase (GGDEF)-like protein
MARTWDRLRILVPASIAARGLVFAGLIAGTMVGAGFIGLVGILWLDFQPLGVITWLPAAAALSLGLSAAWAWFTLTIERPVRRTSAALATVQRGLTEVAAESLAPEEIRQLAEAVADARDDLRHWRGEAANLRQTLESRVAARTRRAEAARRRAQLEADTDLLTRLGSRRVLERDLPRLFEEHVRSGRPLSVVMLDLDRFKLFNDGLGHQAGDRLLSFVGELIRATIRRGVDLGIRYGGDEFALVLPDTRLDQAQRVADRLMQLFRQWARTVRDVPPPGLSAGVAERCESGAANWSDLLRRADEALYATKPRSGARRGAAE